MEVLKMSSKKFIILMLAFIIVAVGFGKLGEYHVIREQRITTTETGYRVDFDGHYWLYD